MALTRRILSQTLRDRRTLALILFAPILITGLLFLLLGESDYQPVIAVDQSVSARVAAALNSADAEVVPLGDSSPGSPERALRESTADAVVSMDGDDEITIKILKAGGTRSMAAVGATSEALGDAATGWSEEAGDEIKHLLIKLGAAQSGVVPPEVSAPSVVVDPVFGSTGDTLFNSMAFSLIAIMSFFYTFIVAGIAFVRERTTGTLERMMMTPISRWGVVGGYTLGFGLLGAAQAVLLTLFCIYVLGVKVAGNVGLVLITMVLVAVVAVALGTFASAFATNEFQVMQFIPIVIVPQMFFAGIIDPTTFPLGLGNLAYAMPVYYGASSLERIMIRGEGLADIWPYLLALLAFAVGMSAVNAITLRRYRSY